MRELSITLLLVSIATAVSAQSYNLYDDAKEKVLKMSTKGHHPITDYRDSRRYLMGTIHLGKDGKGYFVDDVYCGFRYRHHVGPGMVPPHEELNVEHTWPQSRFNAKENRLVQKSDLHHLYPSDSKVNGVRGNHIFAEVKGEYPASDCYESSIGHTRGETAFEPPQHHKGNVARALFYFSIRYKIAISPVEEFFLRSWHINDPVDADEIRRNAAIEKIQGNRNPFIDRPELVDTIENF